MRLAERIRPLLLPAGVGLVVMAFFLVIFPWRGFTAPLGWDTPEYIWRAKLSQVVGVSEIGRGVPAGFTTKAGRPAYPVLAGELTSLTRADHVTLAAVLPSVIAAAIGLAAGAFVAGALRRPPWQLAVVAFGVGTSSFLLHLMSPEAYLDNMLAAAVFVTAAIPIAFAAEDRRAVLSGAALLAVGGLIHWTFLLVIGAAVAIAAVILLPASLRAWRSGERGLLATPSGRLGLMVGGGGLAGGALILGVLGDAFPSPRVDPSEATKKLRRDVAAYRFPITLPVAALGAGSLAAGGTPRTRIRHRTMLSFLVAWCAVAAAGVAAHLFFGLNVPSHRFLAFALAVPVLAMIAIVWLGDRVRRFGSAVAALAVAVPVAAAAWLSFDQWRTSELWMDPVKVHEAEMAAAYVDQIDPTGRRPVVHVVGTEDDFAYSSLLFQTIRAVGPPERIDTTYLYVGSPADYQARRPAAGSNGSRFYWERLGSVVRREPLVLLAASMSGGEYAGWVNAHPERELVPGSLAVVEGPVRPVASLPAARTFEPFLLGMLAAASLAILALAGGGWARLLLGSWLRPVEIAAVSPAVGVGALVLVGVVLDRVGLRLVAWGGVLAVAITAATGWVLARRAGIEPATDG